MGQPNAKSDSRVRLIYTSDFRARFRSKLVPFTDYNYFCILANGLAYKKPVKGTSLLRNRTLKSHFISLPPSLPPSLFMITEAGIFVTLLN